MSRKANKNSKNSKIENFEKKKKKMVDRALPIKFGLDPCSGFLET